MFLRSSVMCEPEWQNRIKIDASVQGGKPVINGTRVPVEVIVGALAGGLTIEDVCREYAITDEDVRAALAYATETLSQEIVRAIPSR
jgi:uncharacterized protein (DUF433 family)